MVFELNVDDGRVGMVVCDRLCSLDHSAEIIVS